MTASTAQAIPPSTTRDRLDDLRRRQMAAAQAGSERAVARQHAKGKLTARERIDLLVDPGSFVELDPFVRHRCDQLGMGAERPEGDGVVTGYALVDGRQVCLFAQDFTVFGGTMGEACGGKVLKIMDHALKAGCPIIGINDSGGARIQEGVVSLAFYAELVRRNVQASGVIPQISVVMGPCAGGAAYSPAVTDFVVMVGKTSHMFVTGPDVVRSVLGEQTSVEDLGSAAVNAKVAGNAHHVAPDEAAALRYVRSLLGYLPSSNREQPPVLPDPTGMQPADPGDDPSLDEIIPDSPQRAYDMGVILRSVVDSGDLLEVQALFARNMICAFARIDGHPVGLVANQPKHAAGAIDIDAAEKAARFVRCCDAFNVPILTFVDVPGFMPGSDQERRGIIRRGAKLAYAYAEASVPLITVVTRKAYGGGYGVMGSKHLGADINLAWPTAEIAVMGAEAAVSVLNRTELAGAGDDAPQLREKLVTEYRNTLLTPYAAAERGYLDAVIMPAETRDHLRRALDSLRDKRVAAPSRKHGNIPL